MGVHLRTKFQVSSTFLTRLGLNVFAAFALPISVVLRSNNEINRKSACEFYILYGCGLVVTSIFIYIWDVCDIMSCEYEYIYFLPQRYVSLCYRGSQTLLQHEQLKRNLLSMKNFMNNNNHKLFFSVYLPLGSLELPSCLNLVRKYTPIFSSRKYTFQYQGPLNFSDVSIFSKKSAFSKYSSFILSNSVRFMLDVFTFCFQLL